MDTVNYENLLIDVDEMDIIKMLENQKVKILMKNMYNVTNQERLKFMISGKLKPCSNFTISRRFDMRHLVVMLVKFFSDISPFLSEKSSQSICNCCRVVNPSPLTKYVMITLSPLKEFRLCETCLSDALILSKELISKIGKIEFSKICRNFSLFKKSKIFSYLNQDCVKIIVKIMLRM